MIFLFIWILKYLDKIGYFLFAPPVLATVNDWVLRLFNFSVIVRRRACDSILSRFYLIHSSIIGSAKTIDPTTVQNVLIVNFIPDFMMWKAAVGSNIKPPVVSQDDDEWDTDPNYINNVTEEEQRWGGGRTAGAIEYVQLNIYSSLLS